MNNVKTLLLAIPGLLITIACNTSSRSDVLVLNNGAKWKVNTEMKPFIEKGDALLDEFISQNGTDYHGLAVDLKNQNDSLIRSCTMKGESHEELHKWLHPHLKLVDNLANAGTSSEATEIITQIDKSYETFQDYFE